MEKAPIKKAIKSNSTAVKKVPVSRVREIADNLSSNSVLKAREAKRNLIREGNNPSMRTINEFNSAYKDKANADRYNSLANKAVSKLKKK